VENPKKPVSIPKKSPAKVKSNKVPEKQQTKVLTPIVKKVEKSTKVAPAAAEKKPNIPSQSAKIVP
jgi:hypothetical protein